MDWDAFFAKTCEAARVRTNAELAAKLSLTPGAVSHYRTGKRVPPVWIVALCLRLQDHPEPEREAARIMLATAHSTAERSFWKKLASAAAIVVLTAGLSTLPTTANAGGETMHYANYALAAIALILTLLRRRSHHATALLA